MRGRDYISTNTAHFVIDAFESLRSEDASAAAAARSQAQRTWPAIVGFAGGAAVGAAVYAAASLSSLAVPAGLALIPIGLARYRT